MRIRWRKFERSMRPLLRPHDARRRMSLWQRFAQWCKTETVVAPHIWSAIGMVAAIMLIVGLRATIEPANVAWLVTLNLFGLATAGGRAGWIDQISAMDREYLTLWFLPLTTAEIFRIVARRILINLCIIFALFASVYGFMSAHAGIPIWCGIACAMLQALVSIAFSGILVAIAIPTNAIAGFVVLLSLLSILVSSDVQFGATIKLIPTWLNPSAWANAFYVEAFVSKTPGAFRWLAASAALVATLPLTAWRFCQLHEMGAFRKKVVISRGRPMIERPPKGMVEAAASQRLGVGDLHCETRAVNWEARGLIERVVASALKPREKAIVETLASEKPCWNRSFGWLVLSFTVFLAVNYFSNAKRFSTLANGLDWNSAEQFFALGLIVLGAFALGSTLLFIVRLFTWYAWPEHSILSSERKGLPSSFRLFPLNYWEGAVVIAKVNAVIALALIPIATLLSLSPAWTFVDEAVFHHSIWIQAVIVAIWCASFFVPALSFTPSMEDGIKHWLGLARDGVVYGCLAILAVGAIGAPSFKLLFLAGLIGGSIVWFRHIGKRYNAGRH